MSRCKTTCRDVTRLIVDYLLAGKMKRILSIMGSVGICAVFLPLFAALLFAFPVEFIVATWQNMRVDSSAKGVITKSEVTRSRGSSEGSSVAYSFEIDGRLHESSRRTAGLFSNSSQEEGGGEFARQHPVGTEVEVFYDSSDPGFSLLERGFPKWSLGFSIAVWGMLMSQYFKRTDKRTSRLLIAYPIFRAMTIVGFLTIFISPPTLTFGDLMTISIGFGAITFCALVWLLISGLFKSNQAEP